MTEPKEDRIGKNMDKGIAAWTKADYSRSAEDLIKDLHRELAYNDKYEGFDSMILRQAKFVSCDIKSKSVKWDFTVTPILCNKGGNLHGGAAATLLDLLTSTALLTIAKPGFLSAGHVSRNLNTTYLRPVPAGTKTTVEVEVVAAGKTTAMVRGVIKTLDGKICVHCAHDKAVFPTKSSKL